MKMGLRNVRLGIAALVVAAVVITPSGPLGASGHRSTTDVFAIDGSGVMGQATMIRGAHNISVAARTQIGGELFELPAGIPLGADWEAGDATTMWFVLFNQPDACTDACGEDDVIAAFGGDNAAEIGIHFATGHVAGRSWGAAASLREWDSSGAIFGMPLKDAAAAEVHVVFRSHGPAANLTPAELHDAIHSVDGGCGTNTCGDAQAAIFLP